MPSSERCELYLETAGTSRYHQCVRPAKVVLRCLDTEAPGPDREASFEWRVCKRHAKALRHEYEHGPIRIVSEEPYEEG